jgi:hypothetical protein
MEENSQKIESLKERIGKYSSKKLIDIVEKQADAYSEEYLDLAKNELIRRGETFTFDKKMQEDIDALSDDELKEVIEKDNSNYNLEYLELASIQYIKRGFKNHSNPFEENTSKTPPKVESINFIIKIFGKKPIEETIRQNIIIPTFWLGIIGTIIDAVLLYNANEITQACTTLLFGISGILALCILLAGFAEIITLLRQISKK